MSEQKNYIQPKVSIIIPIYNAEKYILKCLESLTRQTLNSYEIICVDDGSTDLSLKIIEDYASSHLNIKVFHISNSGVWKARKYGITKANGKYIGFCDSDDTVEPEMYNVLFNIAEKEQAQISVTAYKRIDIDTKRVYSTEMKSFGNSTLNVRNNIGYLTVINTSLWNKLFLASSLRNVVDFIQPPRIAEDMMFLLSIYPFIDKIAFCDTPLYNYYVRNNSAMQTIKQSDVSLTQNAMLHTKQFIMKYSTSDEVIDLIDLFAFIHLGISLNLGLISFDTKGYSDVNKCIKKYLDNYFSRWKHNRYLRISYNIKHGFKLIKPCLVAFIYKTGLFVPFAKTYNFITQKLKISLKW